MNLETMYRWRPVIHLETEKTPCRFGGGEITCVDEILNFIDLILSNRHRSIAPFEDIFEEIFKRTDAGANFDVDMSIVTFGKVWTVWNDPSIVVMNVLHKRLNH